MAPLWHGTLIVCMAHKVMQTRSPTPGPTRTFPTFAHLRQRMNLHPLQLAQRVVALALVALGLVALGRYKAAGSRLVFLGILQLNGMLG